MNGYSFEKHSDDRGDLISWENNKNIPFEIKRVYCIYGNTDKSRGFHAHRNEESILVCLKGSLTVVVNDGKKEIAHHLSNPCKGLYIGKLTWIQMQDFAEETILLVLSDSLYNENDYIRDYDEFIERVQDV